MKHFVLCLLLASSSLAFAESHVVKVKDQKVLGEASPGDSIKAGDKFIAMSPEGKRTAIIEVKTVRGQKWVGVIAKGRADVESTLLAPKRKSSLPKKGLYWGAGIYYGMSNWSAKLPSGTAVSLSGSGAGAEGVVDWDFKAPHRLRTTLTYLPLVGTGAIAGGGTCTDGSPNCKIQISYLSVRSHAQYLIGSGKYLGFVGGGIGLHMPLSKSTNILDPAQIGFTQTFEASAGMDVRLPRNLRFSAGLEYLMFPSSDSVKVQQMAIAVHLLKPF